MTGQPHNLPRPPHTCPVHPEGSQGCYNRHGCRCRACTDTRTATTKRSTAGTSTRVPAGPLVAHLATLGAGMTYRDLAAATGVHEATIRSILEGRVTSCHRATARSILATTSSARASTGRADLTGTRRRLRALAAIGWSQAAIAAHLGVAPRTILRLRSASHPISAAHRELVRALYGQLQHVTPAGPDARQARRWAARAGWPPPAAWDDDTMDDPDPLIDRAARRAAGLAGRHTDRPGGSTIDNIRWLAGMGHSLPEIMSRLHLARSSIYTVLHRHDRDDLWQQLTRSRAA